MQEHDDPNAFEVDCAKMDSYPDLDDEPFDDIVAQQELEDFEQADEYFGFYGSEDDWGF